MRIMRFTLSLLAIGLVLTGLLSCTDKQKSTQLTAEPRWLRVYHDGEFKWKIDVSEWEVGEDVIDLGFFYYPWQGEDSIDYDYHVPEEFLPYLDSLNHHRYSKEELRKIYGNPQYPHSLNVNGKWVGLDIYAFPLRFIPHRESLLTVWQEDVGFDDDTFFLEDLRSFPNPLIASLWLGSKLETREKRLKELEALPSHIRLVVSCKDVTDEDLKRLSKLQNIREIYINSDRITNKGLSYLGNLKELRVLFVRSRTIKVQRFRRIIKRLKKLRDWEYRAHDYLEI